MRCGDIAYMFYGDNNGGRACIRRYGHVVLSLYPVTDFGLLWVPMSVRGFQLARLLDVVCMFDRREDLQGSVQGVTVLFSVFVGL